MTVDHTAHGKRGPGADAPGAPPRRRGGRAARIAAARPHPGDVIRLDPALKRRPGWPTSEDRAHNGRMLAIACGALVREILALRSLNGWDLLDVRGLPAQLHNRPEAIVPRLERAIDEAWAQGYQRVFIGYADCGTGGGVDALADRLGAERLPGAHCYAFFDGLGGPAADGEREIDAFYLTDFLARHFDALIWRGLGLDRAPDLREIYFAHYTRVVYLAQTDDPALDAAACAAAGRLGLPLERRRTGYGALATTLEAAVSATPARAEAAG